MGMHVHPWGFMLMYGKTIQYCKVKVKIKDKKKLEISKIEDKSIEKI